MKTKNQLSLYATIYLTLIKTLFLTQLIKAIPFVFLELTIFSIYCIR